MAHHHCGCKIMPPDYEARLHADPHVDDASIPYILADAGLAPESARTDARVRFKPFDDHLLYVGKMPRDRSQPQLSLDGKRVDAARFAYATYGHYIVPQDTSMRRNTAVCTVPECFAPRHWILTDAPRASRAERQHQGILEDLYPLAFGQPPKFQPTKWLGDSWSATCDAGHALRVYDIGTRHKSSYCATCRKANKAWHKRFADWKRDKSIGLYNGVEDFVVARYHSHPDDRDDLPLIWRMLHDHFTANPADGRDPAIVHAELTGLTGEAPAEDYATPSDAIDWDEMMKGQPA